MNKLKYDGAPIKIMEVCGTHTSAIVRSGLRDLLPPRVSLVSGPGCPVCVTSAGYIDKLIEFARGGAVICSFGDMLKVPGKDASLATARAEGADIRVVYSPFDALK
ncbi:MAG: hydrogenase formation protein HypD, partial [Clostridia bacterium]